VTVMNNCPLLLVLIAFFPFALSARPLGKTDATLDYKIVASGTIGTQAEVIDGITFRLKRADGTKTTYRLAFLRLPRGQPAQAAAKEGLARVFDREKSAVYSSGQTTTNNDGETFELAFINTARGLFSARLMADGLADPGGAGATLPDGTGEIIYEREMSETWRKAESAERGQFGDLKPPPIDKRINLNTATSAELQELPGVGPSTAAKIIAARPIRSVAKLKKIDGIGRATFEKLEKSVKTND